MEFNTALEAILRESEDSEVKEKVQEWWKSVNETHRIVKKPVRKAKNAVEPEKPVKEKPVEKAVKPVKEKAVKAVVKPVKVDSEEEEEQVE